MFIDPRQATFQNEAAGERERLSTMRLFTLLCAELLQ